MQMLFEVALFTASVWLCGTIGASSQAANQVALSFASLTFMFAMGLSVTAMIRVSNQKGLGDYKKLLVVARSIFFLAIMIEFLFAGLFIAFHEVLPMLFLNPNDLQEGLTNAEVVGIASKLLIIAAIFQISDGIQVVVLGALRGLQDVKIPMYITFVAYWVLAFSFLFNYDVSKFILNSITVSALHNTKPFIFFLILTVALFPVFLSSYSAQSQSASTLLSF